MRLKLYKEAQETLAHLGVEAIVLFGSRAQGTERENSDFDIGVLMKDTTLLSDHGARRRVYERLYEILEQHINLLVNIDIVFLEIAPSELQAHVMKYGSVIFEARPGAFADFKAFVMQQYADFAPMREIFHRGMLSQIS